MGKLKRTYGLITILLATIIYTQPLIQKPSYSPNGTQIAFNYQGDIWTVNSDGSNAKGKDTQLKRAVDELLKDLG